MADTGAVVYSDVGPDPRLTREAVLAWLRERGPDERYMYLDHKNCLAAQYNKSIGRDYKPVAFGREFPNRRPQFDYWLERVSARAGGSFVVAIELATRWEIGERKWD